MYKSFHVNSKQEKTNLLLEKILPISGRGAEEILLEYNETSALMILEEFAIKENELNGGTSFYFPLQKLYSDNKIKPSDYKSKYNVLSKLDLRLSKTNNFTSYNSDSEQDIYNLEKLAMNLNIL